MSFSTLRTGLATNLATITGLRTSAIVPDQPNPPIAVILPDNIAYDIAFKRGADTYTFIILLIVGRMDERSAQNLLDSYCAPSGATSVKTAVESDRTLGGAAFDCRVTNMRAYRSLMFGEVTYLSAEFSVEVIAQ
jgi:hypothetical protein